MRNIYFFLLSLMATLVLFMIVSLFYRQNTNVNLNLDAPIEIVLKSTEGESMDFWDVVNLGIYEASKELGVQVHITGPRFEKEINRQITILNKIIESNPPLIILAATDYVRLTDSVRRAHDLNIPIITLDSGVDSPFPISFIGTDNIIAGNEAGEELKKLINESTNNRKEIAIVSHLKGTTTAIDREKGAREALNGLKIVGTWFCDVEEDMAYRIALDLLTNENLGGIVALNEVATNGVARAIEEKGVKDLVQVVGFDNSVREITYLEKGIIKATVVQRPYNMGYLAIKTAVSHFRGDKIVPNVDTGSILITKENMFKREYQELIFPFSN